MHCAQSVLHTVCAVFCLTFCYVVLENWFQNGDDMSGRSINQKVKSSLKSSRLLEALNFAVHELPNTLWKNKAKIAHAWLLVLLILSCVAWKGDQNFPCCSKAFLQLWCWSQRVRCATFKYNIKATRRGVGGECTDSTTVATTEVPCCGCKDTGCQNCLFHSKNHSLLGLIPAFFIWGICFTLLLNGVQWKASMFPEVSRFILINFCLCSLRMGSFSFSKVFNIYLLLLALETLIATQLTERIQPAWRVKPSCEALDWIWSLIFRHSWRMRVE